MTSSSRLYVDGILFALVGLLTFSCLATPTRVRAQPQEQANVHELVLALENLDAQVQALETVGIEYLRGVRVVNVNSIMNNIDESQRQTIRKAFRVVDLQPLRSTLRHFEFMLKWLNREDVQIREVVAVDALRGLTEGTLVVYVDPDGRLG